MTDEKPIEDDKATEAETVALDDDLTVTDDELPPIEAIPGVRTP